MIKILSDDTTNLIAINIKKILENVTEVKIISKFEKNYHNDGNLYIILYNVNSKLPKKYIYYHVDETELNNNKNFFKLKEIWEMSIYKTIHYEENIDLYNVKYSPIPYYNAHKKSKKIKYDILFFGNLSERRMKILKEIKKKHMIKIINNMNDGYKYISISKIILNLNASKNAFLETVKINEILNYNKIIISERQRINDYQNYKLYSNLVVFFDIIKNDLSNMETLYNLIDYYLKDDNYNYYVSNLNEKKKTLETITADILMKNLNINKQIKNYPNENIFAYIKYSNKLMPYKYVLKKLEEIIYVENVFNVDVNFYKYINNIDLDFKSALEDISNNGISNGLIYHPKQIENLYPNSKVYYYNKKYYLNNIELKNFVETNIYNGTFNDFMENYINIEYSNILDSELLILVFIGDERIGVNLLTKIMKYNKKYCIGICFNNYEIYLKLQNIIVNEFKNCCICISKNYGNDIIPTLQMYWYINTKIKFKYIIKTHTKTNEKWFNELNDYLFLNEYKINNNCNCIGNPNYYLSIYDEESFELNILKDLKDKYSNIISKKEFIKGSIFYCDKIIFDKVIEFIKLNNYRQYYTNNLYDSNIINIKNSPVHWLERLFGII